MVAASAFVWLLSLAILFGGLVLVWFRSMRRIGLLMLAGSVGLWIVSMSMCAAGMPEDKPTAAKRDARTPDAGPKPASTTSGDALLERERPPGGAWRSGDAGEAAKDGTTAVSYQLASPDTIRGWLREKKPTLVVRCEGRKTEVYVVTEMGASVEWGKQHRHTVGLRFDSAPARQELWSESTDDKALFAPDGLATARRLAAARTLTFEFTPFNANRQAATFDLTGVPAVVARVATACGWTP
jgi:hypothetical protein